MKFDVSKLKWTRNPKEYEISDKKIEIVTLPHTDLWQETYYHFKNDNAPVLQLTTDERYFSFVVKTQFLIVNIDLINVVLLCILIAKTG